MSNFTTGQMGNGYISYLWPLAFFAQQVSVSICLLPIQFKGVGPHQLPVTQVVNLTPLLLCCNACQKLFLGLQRNSMSFQFTATATTTTTWAEIAFLKSISLLHTHNTSTHKCEVSFEQCNSCSEEEHEGSLWTRWGGGDKKKKTTLNNTISLKGVIKIVASQSTVGIRKTIAHIWELFNIGLQ